MRIHFIVHEAFEALGAYYDWTIKRGHDVTITKLYQGERLRFAKPASVNVIG